MAERSPARVVIGSPPLSRASAAVPMPATRAQQLAQQQQRSNANMGSLGAGSIGGGFSHSGMVGATPSFVGSAAALGADSPLAPPDDEQMGSFAAGGGIAAFPSSGGGNDDPSALTGDPDLDSPLGGILGNAGYAESTALEMPVASYPSAIAEQGLGGGGGARRARSSRRTNAIGGGAGADPNRDPADLDTIDGAEVSAAAVSAAAAVAAAARGGWGASGADSASGSEDDEGEDDDDGEGDEDGGGHSSDESSSTRGTGGGDGRGGGGSGKNHRDRLGSSATGWGSHSSSAASSRMLHLDEEVAQAEFLAQEGARAQRAKEEAERRRRERAESDQAMPCPAMCGVSWGIRGELVYFSNLPLLTHYLVTNQRRRGGGGASAAAASMGVDPALMMGDSASNLVGGSTANSVLQSPTTLADAGPYIDHEEEESSAWAGASASQLAAHQAAAAAAAAASQGSTTLTFPSLPASSPSSVSHGGLVPSASSAAVLPAADLDDVLPRSYHDLLQLPFVAAHLGYVVGGGDDPLDDPTGLGTGIDDANEHDRTLLAQGGMGTETRMSTPSPRHDSTSPPSNAAAVAAADGQGAPALAADGTGSPAVAGSAVSGSPSASQPVPPPPPAVVELDLGSIDLNSVVLSPSGHASLVPSGSNQSMSMRSSLKPSASNSSLPRPDSSSLLALDELGYDLLQEELEAENVSGNPGQEDFFASFYSSSGQGVGLSSSAAMGMMPSATAFGSGGTFYRSGSSATSGLGKSSVPMVPPLPAQIAEAQAAAAAAAGASGGAMVPGTTTLAPATSAAQQGSGVTAHSTSTAGGRSLLSPSSSNESLNGSTDVGRGSGGGMSSLSTSTLLPPPLAHTWSALSQSIQPGASAGYARRRVRINTAVLLMDLSPLMPCSEFLARRYSVSGADVLSVCRTNEAAAREAGREDLAETWALVATISHPSVRDNGGGADPLNPWNENPLGGRLAQELLNAYLRAGDIQSVAMLATVFSQSDKSASLLPGSDQQPAVTILFQETEGAAIVTAEKGGSEGSSLASTASGGNALSPNQTQQPGAGTELSPTMSSRHTPSPGSAAAGVLSPGASFLPASHPAHLLSSNPEASSRTWGPGSKGGAAGNRAGNLSAGAANSLRSSNYSSGTASPSDTIYNINATQRLKWRTGPSGGGSEGGGGGSASAEQQRIRAGSMSAASREQQHERFPRIEETRGGVGGTTPRTGATPHTGTTPAGENSLSPAASATQLYSPPALLRVRLNSLDLYRLIYAEYLYRVGALCARAAMLKGLSDPQPQSLHALTGFNAREEEGSSPSGGSCSCAHCGREQIRGEHTHSQSEKLFLSLRTPPSSSSGALATSDSQTDSSPPALPSLPRCSGCLHFPSLCSVCSLSVRGALLSCGLCGHGGHPAHIASWFLGTEEGAREEQECPSGCGCRCIEAGGLDLSTPKSSTASSSQRQLNGRSSSSKHGRHSSSTASLSRSSRSQHRRHASSSGALGDDAGAYSDEGSSGDDSDDQDSSSGGGGHGRRHRRRGSTGAAARAEREAAAEALERDQREQMQLLHARLHAHEQQDEQLQHFYNPTG